MTTDSRDLLTLPANLPIPQDDGRASHLVGTAVPSVLLPATDGTLVDLSTIPGRTVVFGYPLTGRPDQPSLVPDWDQIPGARGCTPQTCGFRDLAHEFEARGYRVFGLSTQPSAYQQEMVSRLHVPFPVLSDATLALTTALRLPTLTVADQTLLARIAWVQHDARIVQVWYPVFPPDRNAATVLAWVQQQA